MVMVKAGLMTAPATRFRARSFASLKRHERSIDGLLLTGPDERVYRMCEADAA